MKYERVTKIQRNQAIIDHHLDHPELSLQEIGDIYGITRQRVSQIILRDKKGVNRWQR